jgi:hypothetical protein
MTHDHHYQGVRVKPTEHIATFRGLLHISGVPEGREGQEEAKLKKSKNKGGKR